MIASQIVCDGCGKTVALMPNWSTERRCAVADLTDREVLTRLCQTFERAAWEGEDIASNAGGARVPYHGPFASVLHLPSVHRDVEEIAAMLRRHLETTTEPDRQGVLPMGERDG